MKIILSCVGDPGVNCPDPPFIASALNLGEALLPGSRVPQVLDNLAVTGRRERFQPKIDANLTIAGRQIDGDLNVEANPPFTARVLDERAAFCRLW